MKSLAYNQRRSERAKSEDGTDRRSRAHDGFYREVSGQESPSIEQRVIDETDDDDRQKRATSELDALAARVADHPLAGRVLQKRLEGLRKPAEIAKALGVLVDEVYRANDVLRRNLRALRKTTGHRADEEREEE
jgi:hypothetical protein